MAYKLKRKLLGIFILAVLLAAGLNISHSTLAAPVFQLTPFPTPTPGPDGRILYKVQPGDTLLRISLIAGVPLDQLRGLNNLIGDNIVVGQELLLGLGGPSEVTPTPGPSPTPTPLLPTPSPVPGVGMLCVLLYDDINGDAIRQETEPSIPGGAISVSNRSGSFSETVPTKAGLDPHCFENLSEGEYSITVAVPDGYNPTTATSFVLNLKAGDETYLGFGAQVNSVNQLESPGASGTRRSPLLGILGGVLLLASIALAIFGTRLLRGK
jgi:LysM domain/SdrD B-like domain